MASSSHLQYQSKGNQYGSSSSSSSYSKYGQPSSGKTPRSERSRAKVAAFDRIATLDKVPLLSSLGKSQKAQLAKELLVKVYPKGAQVMVQGQEGDFFLIIVDGKLDVTASSGGHLAYLSDGDYAGEQALLKATTRNASLTAVEETTCLLCSKHTFDKIKKSVKFANRCSVYILSPIHSLSPMPSVRCRWFANLR